MKKLLVLPDRGVLRETRSLQRICGVYQRFSLDTTAVLSLEKNTAACDIRMSMTGASPFGHNHASLLRYIGSHTIMQLSYSIDE